MRMAKGTSLTQRPLTLLNIKSLTFKWSGAYRKEEKTHHLTFVTWKENVLFQLSLVLSNSSTIFAKIFYKTSDLGRSKLVSNFLIK